MELMKRVGSRAEVWHGKAKKTSGGLEKKDLFYTKRGRIVSKKKHFSEKKTKRLEKAGFFAKKGSFGAVRLENLKYSNKVKKLKKMTKKAQKPLLKKLSKSNRVKIMKKLSKK